MNKKINERSEVVCWFAFYAQAHLNIRIIICRNCYYLIYLHRPKPIRPQYQWTLNSFDKSCKSRVTTTPVKDQYHDVPPLHRPELK